MGVSGSSTHAYQAMRTDVAAVPVERDLVVVSGADAETFLQGQISQDTSILAVSGPSWSFLLHPNGKVAAWLRIARLGADRFVLDVDPGWGPTVASRLERFKLRVKVEIEVTERWRAVAVRGPGLGAVALTTACAELILPADWPGSPGADLLGPSVQVPEGVLEAPVEVLEAVRIEAGVPRMGAELDESTIPAEAGSWVVESSVSFTKGCYVGQELVARIESRGGHVPRHLRGLELDGVDRPPSGAVIVVDGREVGRVTSAAPSPRTGGVVALGSVARAVEPPCAAVVRWDDRELSASVRPLPLVHG
jgi:folate-binding protein YgfZ